MVLKGMKKKLIAGCAVIVVVILLFIIIGSNEAKVEFKTTPVEQGDIESLISTTGTINPVDSVEVGSQVSGNIMKINVDFNSQVKAGQLIAEIDPSIYQARLAEAKANLLRSEVSLKQAERSLKRGGELYKQSFISDNDIEDLEFAVDSAKATLEQLKANYDLSITNLKNCKIFSPIDGVVISRKIDIGQTVAASFQAPTLFIIAKDLAKMQIEVNIDEADIGKIKEGQSVKFDVDAFPEETFMGKIKQVRLEPTTISNVVTYTIIVDVNNDDLKLKPGMTANVSVIEAQAKNVLTIPMSALRLKIPDDIASRYQKKTLSGGEKEVKEASGVPAAEMEKGTLTPGSFPASGGNVDRSKMISFFKEKMAESTGKVTFRKIWTLDDDGRIEQHRVMLGISDGDFIELVKGGLKKGDKVITDLLVDGKPLVSEGEEGFRLPFGMRGGRR